ncbi:hypothetical protein D3C75_851180 [compost metagenome]
MNHGDNDEQDHHNSRYGGGITVFTLVETLAEDVLDNVSGRGAGTALGDTLHQGIFLQQVNGGQQDHQEHGGGQHGQCNVKQTLPAVGAVDAGSLIQLMVDVIDAADKDDHIKSGGGPVGRKADDEGGQPRIQRPLQRGAAKLLHQKVDQAVLLAEHPVDRDTNNQGREQHGYIDQCAGQGFGFHPSRSAQNRKGQGQNHLKGQAEQGINDGFPQRCVEILIRQQAGIVVQPDKIHRLPSVVIG